MRVLVFGLLTSALSVLTAATQSRCLDSGFYKLGCYRDSVTTRGLKKLLINERVDNHGNHTIDWYNWNEYLDGLTCRCAAKAREKGYEMFSLQFYGECWGGFGACDTYDQLGPSKHCVGKGFLPCDNNNDEACVGEANANYVYLLTE